MPKHDRYMTNNILPYVLFCICSISQEKPCGFSIMDNGVISGFGATCVTNRRAA